MNTHFTHLSSDIYPDAMKFNPYRWLNAEKEGTKAELEKYFNPFGKGSRNCIGFQCVFSPPCLRSLLLGPLSIQLSSVKADAYCLIVLRTQRCTLQLRMCSED